MRPGVEFSYDGHTHRIEIETLTGREVRLFRSAVGVSPQRAFFSSVAGDQDLDYIAGFIWIQRRRTEPNLAYDEVLDSITWDKVEVVTPDAEPSEGDDPEA